MVDAQKKVTGVKVNCLMVLDAYNDCVLNKIVLVLVQQTRTISEGFSLIYPFCLLN